jgi:D-alanyl-D-alanine carboxypeptidase
MKVRALAIATLIIILVNAGCRGVEVAKQFPTEEATRLREGAVALQAQDNAELFPPKIANKLQAMLSDYVEDRKLPGAVLYITSSEPNLVWMGAAGEADREAKLPMKPTDRFRIGNLSEMFVAVVCLQLAEAGKLQLDDPITNWLPAEVSRRLPKSNRITIRQLLNHTSGLAEPDGEQFKAAVLADPAHRWTAKEMLTYIYDQEAKVPRGTFFYSSANYLLLELIVEKATGSSLAQVIHDRVERPLALKNTFMELQEPIPGGFVQGYQDWNNDRSLKNVTKPLINSGQGLGDKGLVSDAPDLARFLQALFIKEDTLIDSDSLKEMLTLVENNKGGNGLGISHVLTRWGELWGQRGTTTGFMSVILYLPVHDLIVVAWINSADSADPADIAEESLNIILGETK